MDFPKAIIKNIQNNPDHVTLFCDVNKTTFKNQNWLGNNYCGYLMKNDKLISGRWHYSDINGWSFRTSDIDASVIQREEILECIDGYYGERDELMLDTSLKWNRAEFVTKGNWDHDHCGICWAKIDELNSESNKAHMISNKKDLVCLKCFDKYMKSKDVYKMVEDHSYKDNGKGEYLPRK